MEHELATLEASQVPEASETRGKPRKARTGRGSARRRDRTATKISKAERSRTVLVVIAVVVFGLFFLALGVMVATGKR